MSASTLSTARPVNAGRASALTASSSAFSGGASRCAVAPGRVGVVGKRGASVVRMAASKEKKSRDMGMLKGMLENEETLLVAGFRYQGLSVRSHRRGPTTRVRARVRKTFYGETTQTCGERVKKTSREKEIWEGRDKMPSLAASPAYAPVWATRRNKRGRFMKAQRFPAPVVNSFIVCAVASQRVNA